jgi:hypothetical protein
MNNNFLKNNQDLDDFCKKHNISFLGVFGSHARKTAKQDSDIDLLVEFNKPVDFFDMIETEEQLEQKLNRPVDLVTKNSISKRILPHVQKDMITLYERP